MADNEPKVLISGFADESAINKTTIEQFVAFNALGLRQYTIRFVDAGNGVKNVMQLDDSEINHVRALQEEYDLKVTSIGSPIGKVKLLDVEDGTSNKFKPFEEYLADDVSRACQLANTFETKLIRGFSFYPPRDDDPKQHLPLTVDQIGKIVEACAASGCIFGLEVEANLVGRTGVILHEIWQQISHPNLVLIYDAANLLSQGFTADESVDEFDAMREGLGWIHVKDYVPPKAGAEKGYVDEDALGDFRPVNQGSGVYQRVFDKLRDSISQLTESLQSRGVPGLFVELEPHLKGGGQFGGFSGPDGMGVAARALTQMLDELSIAHDCRSYAELSR